jgi:hypothetical protein
VAIRKNVDRDGWALKVCAGLGACWIMAAACAGGDTPPRDDELVQQVHDKYDPNFETGAAGSMTMTGGGGTGGSGGSGTGGSASGLGGSATGGGSSGASGSGSTVSNLPPPTGPTCDAVTKVFPKCSFQPCHGADSQHGSFADSDAAARLLLDKPTQNAACGKYIDSANPDASAILTKLADPPCGGVQMPFNADPLSQSDIDCVRSWLFQF